MTKGERTIAKGDLVEVVEASAVSFPWKQHLIGDVCKVLAIEEGQKGRRVKLQVVLEREAIGVWFAEECLRARQIETTPEDYVRDASIV